MQIADIEITADGRAVTVCRVAIPVRLVAVAQVRRDAQIGKRFTGRNGIQLFVVRDAAAVVAGIEIFAHRHVITLGEAVARKGDFTVNFVETL